MRHPAHTLGFSGALLAALLLAAPALAGNELVLTAAGELKDPATALPAGHPNMHAQAVPAALPADQAPQVTPVAVTPPPAPTADMAAVDPADGSATDTASDAPYVYQARGLRDPFLPPAEVRAPEVSQDIPPLESHALADFRLVAVVRAGRGSFAMVTTGDGKGYTVRQGTRIGPDGGRVRQITKNSVVVEVVTPDEFGELKKSETILALRPEEVVP